MSLVFDITGYAGAFVLLLAYFQVSRGVWQGKAVAFNAANLVGSLLLLVYSWHLDAFANVILNAVWVCVAVVSFVRLSRSRH